MGKNAKGLQQNVKWRLGYDLSAPNCDIDTSDKTRGSLCPWSLGCLFSAMLRVSVMRKELSEMSGKSSCIPPRARLNSSDYGDNYIIASSHTPSRQLSR